MALCPSLSHITGITGETPTPATTGDGSVTDNQTSAWKPIPAAAHSVPRPPFRLPTTDIVLILAAPRLAALRNEEEARMQCRQLGVGVVLMLAMLCLQPARSATAAAANPSSELPEVVVESKRLSRMRQEIIQVENRFFALFNDLNTEDDFDVHCRHNTPTGTRIQQRVCLVQFYEEAQAEWARAQLTGDYAPPAELVALERGPEYKRRALAVINAHPELRRLVKERDALEKKFLATRKERFKGHWFGF